MKGRKPAQKLFGPARRSEWSFFKKQEAACSLDATVTASRHPRVGEGWSRLPREGAAMADPHCGLRELTFPLRASFPSC